MLPRLPRKAFWVVCVCGLLLASRASAQTADNLLLVINSRSEAATQIGDAYIRTRAVQQDHVVHLDVSTAETIARPDYDARIERPIAQWLRQHSLEDKILYIVLTKGVPLRVDGTAGLEGTVASVDSELTLLYRKLLGLTPAVSGRVDNPYFLGDRDPIHTEPFTRFSSDIYLVTRLDGFTVDDVLKLIAR